MGSLKRYKPQGAQSATTGGHSGSVCVPTRPWALLDTGQGWEGTGEYCEVPGAPEQLGRCDSCPDCMELAVPTSPHLACHPYLPTFPASSGVVHLWPLAALMPAVLGSCQVKSWLARLDPTCELFYFPSLPYTASVCFYKYFTSLAKVYFISLLNLLNINAATTLP